MYRLSVNDRMYVHLMMVLMTGCIYISWYYLNRKLRRFCLAVVRKNSLHWEMKILICSKNTSTNDPLHRSSSGAGLNWKPTMWVNIGAERNLFIFNSINVLMSYDVTNSKRGINYKTIIFSHKILYCILLY